MVPSFKSKLPLRLEPIREESPDIAADWVVPSASAPWCDGHGSPERILLSSDPVIHYPFSGAETKVAVESMDYDRTQES
jgi:hypothetical protein